MKSYTLFLHVAGDPLPDFRVLTFVDEGEVRAAAFAELDRRPDVTEVEIMDSAGQSFRIGRAEQVAAR